MLKNVKTAFIVLFGFAFLLSITACFNKERGSNPSAISLNPVATNLEESPKKASIAPSPSGTNVAPLAAVTVSNYDFPHYPEDANDDDFWTWWQSQSGYFGGWITLTWPTRATLNRIFIYHRNYDPRSYPANQVILNIRYFTPESGWSTLSGVRTYTRGWDPYGYGYIYYVDFSFAPIEATAVSFSLRPSYSSWTGHVFVTDIEAYGSMAPPTPVITEIKIKDQDTGVFVGEGPLEMSSLKSIKRFQAIGFSNTTEIGPVPVTWSLVNGDVAPGSTRAGLLSELNSNVGKIAVFSTQVGTFSTILNSEVVTFVSFLSGNISLNAIYPNGVSKAVSVRLKQPTVYLNLKYIQGIAPLSAISLWLDKAKSIWGQENLLTVKEFSSLSMIGNTSFDELPPEQSSEYLFSQLSPPQLPSFLNPLVGDVVADNFYAIGFEEHVVPRQSEELFKNRAIGEKLVNVFVSNGYHSVLKEEVGVIEPVELKELRGAAISSVRYYSRGTGQKINDKNESGIVLTNIPELPGDIPDTARRILAHELGHFLLQTGDDHVYTAPPNVMNDFAPGENILPSQMKIIFDYDKAKNPDSFFIVEE